jgi:mitogen-activated protein kinase kinase kinase
VSPHRGYHSPGIPGPRPRPTHHSDRSDRSSDIQSGAETTNSTPQTPNSPHRYDPAHGFELSPSSSLSSTISTSGNRSSDATLKQEDHVHFANLLGEMGKDVKSHDVPQIQPEPEKLLRQSTPPRSVARNSSGLVDDDYDDDEPYNGDGTWIRMPDLPKNRPPLKVQIGSAVSQRSADTVASQETPPASYLNATLVPNHPPSAIVRPGSTFIDADSDSWAPRPPPENIYDRLDQFFSKHDLDKPVIEAISGDTSPTAEPAIPANSINDKARIKAKKSIRIVAEEHKKRIGRTSMANPAAFDNNVLRKRNTKLWGSKLEELTTFRSNATVSTVSLPESPSSSPSKGIYLVLFFLIMCLY